MRNPHYNKLEKPLKLPAENWIHYNNKIHGYISDFILYKNHEIAPWDIKKQYFTEDVTAMDMLEKMYQDYELLKQKKAEQQHKTQDYIAKNL